MMSDGKRVWEASLDGAESVLTALLERGAPVNWRSGTGSTPLHKACRNNHPVCVKLLLRHSPGIINVQDDDGYTPLHDACSVGSIDCMKLLMSTGQCDLGVMNNYGRSPLGVAIYCGRVDVVRVLVNEYQVKVDGEYLSLAVSEGKLDLVELFIKEYNADINAYVTQFGLTPLGLAISEGTLDIIKLFIKVYKVDINAPVTKSGLTPLGLAVREVKLDIINLFIKEYKVDVNASVTQSGLTPLDLAVSDGELDIIKHLIIKYKADINDPSLVETVLNLAVWSDDVWFIKYLVTERGVDVSALVTQSGLTPLGLAVSYRKLNVINMFIKGCNVDVNAPVTHFGLTPLGLAVSEGNLDVIKYLMKEYKVDVNDPLLVETILVLAIESDDILFIKYLVTERGVDVSAFITQSGLTPLGLAVSEGKLDLIKLFIKEYKVDVNFPTTQSGLTPLGLALSEGKLDLVKLFIKEYKVNINAPVTQSGLTPLDLAISDEKLDIIEHLIIEHKADVNDPSLVKDVLKLAVKSDHLQLIKYLVTERGVEVSGEHFLLSCERGQSRVVQFLLSEANCDPNYKNDAGQTALMFFHDDTDMIKFLLKHGAKSEEVYTSYRKQLGNLYSKDPLVNPVKIYTIGQSGEGKSTVIQSLQKEPNMLAPLKNALLGKREVRGVNQLTAGIQPFYFNSGQYGLVLFYDFAGQEAYYNSHAAVLKSDVTTCPPIFQLVIGLHNDDVTNCHSIAYWLKMIENQCTQMEGKAPLIIIASHFDMVDQAEFDRKKKLILEAIRKFDMFEVIDVVPMDCRYSSSDEIKALRRHVGSCCHSIRKKLSVSLNCQVFQLFLAENYPEEISVTLKRVQVDLESITEKKISKRLAKSQELIPTEEPRLVEVCTQLGDKGHILFLGDKKSPGDSQIIVDKPAVLGRINGSMFAPEGFEQHDKALATSTGVVPKSKLVLHFPELDVDLIVRVLTYLELAAEITDSESLALVKEHIRKLKDPSLPQDDTYLFAPGLIKLEAQPDVWKFLGTVVYRFGWVMSCIFSGHFLDPRFLQVLQLRISLSCNLAPEIVAEVPALQQHCSVWKTGVCWSTTHGAKVLVEIVNKRQVIVLIQASEISSSLFRVRSTVINTVLKARADMCPTVAVKEEVVYPDDLNYPLDTKAIVFNLKSVAESVVNSEPCVVSTSSHSLRVNDLLRAEVYANLGTRVLAGLFSGKELSDSFLSNLCDCWAKTPGLVEIISDALGGRDSSSLGELLRSRRESLREILDPLSVFFGRNPLETAEIDVSILNEDATLPSEAHIDPVVAGAGEPSVEVAENPMKYGPLFPQGENAETSESARPIGCANTLTTDEFSVIFNTKYSHTTLDSSSSGLSVSDLQKRTGVSHSQLEMQVIERDLFILAGCFDNVDNYLDKMGLSLPQQTDIKDLAQRRNTQTAMCEALRFWRQPNPYQATFRVLLEMVLDLNRGDIAVNICYFITERVRAQQISDDKLSENVRTETESGPEPTVEEKFGVSAYQLDTEINKENITDFDQLAHYFDNFNHYTSSFNLSRADIEDVKRTEYLHGHHLAMRQALELWRRAHPAAATYRALLNIVLGLQKHGIAEDIVKFIKDNRQ